MEYLIVGILSVFLFVTPYSRWWGKGALYACLAALFLYRLLLFKGDLVKSLFIVNIATKTGLLLFAACFVSIFFSVDPYHSQKIFFNRYVFFILSAWAGCVIGKEFGKKKLFLFIIAILLCGLYMGYGCVYDYMKLPPGEIRLWTVWGRYTTFCMLPLYLTLYIVFNAAMMFFCANPFFRSFGLVNFILLVPAFIWQLCRSAYPAVAAGILFCMLLKSRKAFLWCLTAMIAFALAAGFLSPTVRHEFGNYADMNKWDNRLPLFKSALMMFRDHPVTGIGMGMYENLIKTPAYEPPPDYMPQYRYFFIHVHNFYLETLAEMGILGIAFFGVLFWGYFRLLIERNSTITDNFIRAIIIGSASIVVVYLIFGISLSVITVGLNESVIFWLFYGLTIGLFKREELHG
jgi:O-antigen ligase